MSRYYTREISMFLLVSLAEQANLNVTLSPMTCFVADLPNHVSDDPERG